MLKFVQFRVGKSLHFYSGSWEWDIGTLQIDPMNTFFLKEKKKKLKFW